MSEIDTHGLFHTLVIANFLAQSNALQTYLARTHDGVMCNFKLLPVLSVSRYLIEIRVAWKIQNKLCAITREALVQFIEVVWLHLCKIKDVRRAVLRPYYRSALLASSH